MWLVFKGNPETPLVMGYVPNLEIELWVTDPGKDCLAVKVTPEQISNLPYKGVIDFHIPFRTTRSQDKWILEHRKELNQACDALGIAHIPTNQEYQNSWMKHLEDVRLGRE